MSCFPTKSLYVFFIFFSPLTDEEDDEEDEDDSDEDSGMKYFSLVAFKSNDILLTQI